MPTPAPVIDTTLTDLVLPSAAILVSAAIALLVFGLQLAAAKRERKSEAIGRVAGAISHVISESGRRRRGEEVDLEPAIDAFDAAIIQLHLAVPRRDRATVMVIRDRLVSAHLMGHVDTTAYSVRNELEGWALGLIPNREFRRLLAWTGGPTEPIDSLAHAWDQLRRQAQIGPDITRGELARMEKYAIGSATSAWRRRLRERVFLWRYRR